MLLWETFFLSNLVPEQDSAHTSFINMTLAQTVYVTVSHKMPFLIGIDPATFHLLPLHHEAHVFSVRRKGEIISILTRMLTNITNRCLWSMSETTLVIWSAFLIFAT